MRTPLIVLFSCACAAGAGGDGGGGEGARSDTGASSSDGAGSSGGSTGDFGQAGGYGGSPATIGGDPKTCAEAASAKTYLGCDFWPTVTANNVWSVFDFAAVVANAGDAPATITVTRGDETVGTAEVAPNGLGTIYLPWVPELKGLDSNACGEATPLSNTVRAPGGAYHLVSTVPVTVYQFSALEYAPQGGPPGKDWSSCPAVQCGLDCYSYSNDASLLLPSTAQTTSYRVLGFPGWSLPALPSGGIGATLAITGFDDGTDVTVSLGPQAAIVAGGGISASGGGGHVTFSLGRGEVVELVGTPTSDFSGSLVQTNHPVQVIHGLPCRDFPDSVAACDHIEESVLPAETLGKHYIVAAPMGPAGVPVPQRVRFFGNVNGTTLTYPSGAPLGAPTTLAAGQVADLGEVAQSFEVIADHELGIATALLGATMVNPGGTAGDPSASVATAVEQYRNKYVFLAPTDYDQNYVDVIMPMGAQIQLDGAALSLSPTPISSGFGIAHVTLPDGNGGAHVMSSDEAFGIQVIGYGSFTSYQYPGGLNLDLIAPPPPPPQ